MMWLMVEIKYFFYATWVSHRLHMFFEKKKLFPPLTTSLFSIHLLINSRDKFDTMPKGYGLN